MKPTRRTIRWGAMLLSYSAAFGFAADVTGGIDGAAANQPPAPSAAPTCLTNNEAFFRARLAGAINAELNWRGGGIECTGEVRPDGHGLRLKFSSNHREPALVIVLGIANVREGESGHALPVNVTIIREGAGEFFGTQGADKCTIDALRQQLLTPVARRARSYKIVARGFCTEPARAVRGPGVVLMNRFDFAGRVDYDTPADSTQQKQTEKTASSSALTEARHF